jgi:hypothetical protein
MKRVDEERETVTSFELRWVGFGGRWFLFRRGFMGLGVGEEREVVWREEEILEWVI